MTSNSDADLAEWRQNWPAVVAAAANVGTAALHYYAFGAFVIPLERAFGWSRGEISGGLMLTSLGMFIASPVIGWMADRADLRKMGLIGITLYCLILGSIGLTGPSLWTWLVAWAVLALVQGLGGAITWSTILAGRFFHSRGLAFALAMCGTAAASAVVPPVATELVKVFGWREAFGIIAATGWLLAFPLAWCFLHYDRDAAISRRTISDVPRICGEHRKFGRIFFQLAISVFAVSCAVSVLIVHLQPMMIDRGMTPEHAALVASGIGIGMFAGRLISGVLMDRFNVNVVAASLFGMPGAACVLLLQFDGSSFHAVLIAAIIGTAAGAETDMIGYIVSRYFSPEDYGRVLGWMMGSYALGSGAGPLVAGLIFDTTSSYAPVLTLLLPTLAIAVGLVLLLGPDKRNYRAIRAK